jgi:hypothetical protein
MFAGQTLDMEFGLLSSDSDVLFSDHILLNPPPLGFFDVSRFFGISETTEQIPLLLDGRLTMVVPEPGTAVLLFSALVLMGGVAPI